MVGYYHCVSTLIDSSTSGVSSKDVLDDKRSLSFFSYPPKIAPGSDSLFQRNTHIGIAHRSNIGNKNVSKLHQAAVTCCCCC